MTDLDQHFIHLHQYLEQFAALRNSPGVAVAVTDREKTLRILARGYANLEAETPAATGTLFEIGSISKSFTAIALLQLREAGLVDLHTPVTRYLPWFFVRSKYESISLHHLLTHTAGLVTGQECTPTARSEAWALRDTETGAPPGTHFHYSNSGYKTLGVVLEDVLRQPYTQIIRERVLDPLGMSATEPVLTHETRKRLAVGYAPFYDDRPFPRQAPVAPATWVEADTGDGSIASTAGDMAAYVRMLLNRGQGPHGRVLSEESFGLMIQPAIETGDEPGEAAYGYGLSLYEIDGRTVVGHTGSMLGYMAAMLADLDSGLGLVVLTNGQRSVRDAAQAGLRILLGQEPAGLASPAVVANSADYAGAYRSGVRALTLEAEGERLYLRHATGRAPLEAAAAPDHFHVLHPDFDLFLLRFGRAAGGVVEAFFGPDWYVNERYAGPMEFDAPADWRAYAGHYRSHNPWYSNFRIAPRKGALAFLKPDGSEEPLIPLENGLFRVGEDERSPERIGFDRVLDGQALRANRSGGWYYRAFTP